MSSLFDQISVCEKAENELEGEHRHVVPLYYQVDAGTELICCV